MSVLDTNAASEPMRPTPDRAVAVWRAQWSVEELFLTAISDAELRYGVMIMPTGRQRALPDASMDRRLDIGFGERIPPFDSAEARTYAAIASSRRRAGRPISETDCRIAAISRARDGALATRNLRDFEGMGVNVVDPWSAAPA